MDPALTPALCETAQWMADELAANRLRVVLVPDWFQPGSVRRLRAVDEQNPGWYRAFCAAHPSGGRRRERRRRLPDTAIKRRHTLRGLRELAGGVCRSEYARRLLPWVRGEHERVEAERAWFTPAMSDEPASSPRRYETLALLELI